MDIQTLQQKLQQEHNELQNELATLGVQNPQKDGDWIATPDRPVDTESDTNDLGDRSEEWEERDATMAVLETRMQNVDRALAKIAANTYGVCELCHEKIEDARLAVNPAARTCKTHIDNEAQLVD